MAHIFPDEVLKRPDSVPVEDDAGLEEEGEADVEKSAAVRLTRLIKGKSVEKGQIFTREK